MCSSSSGQKRETKTTFCFQVKKMNFILSKYFLKHDFIFEANAPPFLRRYCRFLWLLCILKVCDCSVFLLQLHKNGKADVLIKDLYVENAQLVKALEITEQRQKIAEKKNYLLEEKISSLNKIVRDLNPAPSYSYKWPGAPKASDPRVEAVLTFDWWLRFTCRPWRPRGIWSVLMVERPSKRSGGILVTCFSGFI